MLVDTNIFYIGQDTLILSNQFNTYCEIYIRNRLIFSVEYFEWEPNLQLYVYKRESKNITC